LVQVRLACRRRHHRARRSGCGLCRPIQANHHAGSECGDGDTDGKMEILIYK